ncbi:MAG TPA: hypothetical protein VF853_02755 [Candidatus Deferrimicrobiaceae bacterium]
MEIEEFFRSKSFYVTFAIFFDYPHDPLHARLARFGAIRLTDAGREKWYRLRADFRHADLFGDFFRNTREFRRYPGLQAPCDMLEILEELIDNGE